MNIQLRELRRFCSSSSWELTGSRNFPELCLQLMVFLISFQVLPVPSSPTVILRLRAVVDLATFRHSYGIYSRARRVLYDFDTCTSPPSASWSSRVIRDQQWLTEIRMSDSRMKSSRSQTWFSNPIQFSDFQSRHRNSVVFVRPSDFLDALFRTLEWFSFLSRQYTLCNYFIFDKDFLWLHTVRGNSELFVPYSRQQLEVGGLIHSFYGDPTSPCFRRKRFERLPVKLSSPNGLLAICFHPWFAYRSERRLLCPLLSYFWCPYIHNTASLFLRLISRQKKRCSFSTCSLREFDIILSEFLASTCVSL